MIYSLSFFYITDTLSAFSNGVFVLLIAVLTTTIKYFNFLIFYFLWRCLNSYSYIFHFFILLIMSVSDNFSYNLFPHLPLFFSFLIFWVCGFSLMIFPSYTFSLIISHNFLRPVWILISSVFCVFLSVSYGLSLKDLCKQILAS